MCASDWQSPYNAGRPKQSLGQWDLEKLIATQKSGDVPGQDAFRENEELGYHNAQDTIQ